MKSVRILTLLCTSTIILFFSNSLAQDLKSESRKQKELETKELIDSKKFVFSARFVYPMRGGSLELVTSDYDLKVDNDTIKTFLPYFGRAFSAPANPSEGGIKFTSTNFDYTVAAKKKSWEISIKPKDVKDKNTQELFLSVFPNGQASLRVSSLTKDPISFSGHIEKISDKK